MMLSLIENNFNLNWHELDLISNLIIFKGRLKHVEDWAMSLISVFFLAKSMLVLFLDVLLHNLVP